LLKLKLCNSGYRNNLSCQVQTTRTAKSTVDEGQGRMKLNLKQADTEIQPQWQPILGYPWQPEFAPSTWVQLWQQPNPYSHDEALLL